MSAPLPGLALLARPATGTMTKVQGGSESVDGFLLSKDSQPYNLLRPQHRNHTQVYSGMLLRSITGMLQKAAFTHLLLAVLDSVDIRIGTRETPSDSSQESQRTKTKCQDGLIPSPLPVDLVAFQGLEPQHIATPAKPNNLSQAYRRQQGAVPKALTRVDVAHMHLNDWQANG